MAEVEVFRLTIPVEMRDAATPSAERLDKLLDSIEKRHLRPRVDDRDIQTAHTRTHELDSVLDRISHRSVTVRVGIADAATAPIRALYSLTSSYFALMAAQRVAEGVTWPLRLAGNLEQTLTSYRTFLGSQERAVAFQRQMEGLADISPFHTAALEHDAVGLLNVSRNAEFTMRALRAFGDTAAATGVGEDAMSRGLLGFEQMAARGTITIEDLNQVTENMGISRGEVARQLGVTTAQLENLSAMGITSSRALEAVLKVMETAPYAGGMAAQARTFNGLMTTLTDTFTRSARAFGIGMLSELEPRLAAAVKWTGDNKESVDAWNQSLTELGRGVMGGPLSFVEGRLHSIRDTMASDLWRTGTDQSRAQMFWQNTIVKPFNDWWASSGQQSVTKFAGGAGDALGRGLGDAVLGGLGAVLGAGPMGSAGSQAAYYFFRGFMGGLVDAASGGNWEKVADIYRKVFTGDIAGARDAMERLVYKMPMGSSIEAARALEEQRQGERGAGRPPPPPGGGANGGGGMVAGAAAPGVSLWQGGEPLTRDQFTDAGLRARFRAVGLTEDSVANACGPIMAAGLARSIGIAADPAEIAKYGQQTGFWDPKQGVTRATEGPLALLAHAGVAAMGLDPSEAMQRAQAGQAVGINTPKHYYLATGYDPRTGAFHVGTTGTSLAGGSADMTLGDITRLGQGPASYLGVDWAAQARAAASSAGFSDPAAFARQMAQESGGFDPAVISGQRRSAAGATGIAQFMPGTAQRLGVDPLDPEASLLGAARYMLDLEGRYGGVENALRAYNAGEGAIAASHGYGETNAYVDRVLGPSGGGAGGAPGGFQAHQVTINIPLNVNADDPAAARRLAEQLGPEIMRVLTEVTARGLGNKPFGVKGT